MIQTQRCIHTSTHTMCITWPYIIIAKTGVKMCKMCVQVWNMWLWNYRLGTIKWTKLSHSPSVGVYKSVSEELRPRMWPANKTSGFFLPLHPSPFSAQTVADIKVSAKGWCQHSQTFLKALIRRGDAKVHHQITSFSELSLIALLFHRT